MPLRYWPVLWVFAACSTSGGAGTGTSGGGTTGGGASSGGVSGGTSGAALPRDGGCGLTLRGTELVRCVADADCGCPQRCVVDPGLGTAVCELPCLETSDCPSAVTHCEVADAGGLCQLSFCWKSQAGASLPGTPGSGCSATSADAGDGTCIPALRSSGDGGPIAAFAYCVPNGAATASCNAATADNPAGPDQDFDAPGISRTPASDYCGAGEACVTSSAGEGRCATFCAPPGGCAPGEVCRPEDAADPSFGLCGPCIQAGQACLSAAECCTGSCDPVNGCAGGCDPTTGVGC